MQSLHASTWKIASMLQDANAHIWALASLPCILSILHGWDTEAQIWSSVILNGEITDGIFDLKLWDSSQRIIGELSPPCKIHWDPRARSGPRRIVTLKLPLCISAHRCTHSVIGIPMGSKVNPRDSVGSRMTNRNIHIKLLEEKFTDHFATLLDREI